MSPLRRRQRDHQPFQPSRRLDLTGQPAVRLQLGGDRIEHVHLGGARRRQLGEPALLDVAVAGAAGAGAAQFGGSKGSMLWAIIGCILGAILFTPLIPIPIVGTIIGACIGSFAGATLYEFLQAKKQLHTAAWVGMGAAMGKVAGMFAKTLIGVIMIAVAAMMY